MNVDRAELKKPSDIYLRIRASLYSWEHTESLQIGVNNADLVRTILDLHKRLIESERRASESERRLYEVEAITRRLTKKRNKK